MIIDVHYHIMPIINEKRVAITAKHAIRAAEIMGIKINPEELIKRPWKHGRIPPANA